MKNTFQHKLTHVLLDLPFVMNLVKGECRKPLDVFSTYEIKECKVYAFSLLRVYFTDASIRLMSALRDATHSQ